MAPERRIELTADQGYQPIQVRTGWYDVTGVVRTGWYDVTGVALFVLADGPRFLTLHNIE